MIDSLLSELVERGLELHYLRNHGPHWEAMIRFKLLDDQQVSYAIGFGYCHGSPFTALSNALEALENDPAIEIERLQAPTCEPVAPSVDLRSLLSHLRPQHSWPKIKV